MKTVFVVERALSEREVLTASLRQLNYHVVVFQPGEKFVDQLIKSNADLIFINEEHYFLRQPILRLYLQMHPNLQIILTTESFLPSSVLDEYKCKYSIEKPYNFKSISSVVNALPVFVPEVMSRKLLQLI